MSADAEARQGEDAGGAPPDPAMQFSLLDSGNFKRLEQFGPLRVQRPCPSAAWNVGAPKAWTDIDLTYKVPTSGKSTAAQTGEWVGVKKVPLKTLRQWHVSFGASGVQLQLNAADSGQVGVFAEQLDNWHFIKESVIAAAALRRTDAAGADSGSAAGAAELQQAGDSSMEQESGGLRILNGFAYTGGSTIAAARALEAPDSSAGGCTHVQVTHLDGSKTAVEWAKRNAQAVGLADTAIRWMAEDCLTFVEREVKRGTKYDALIFDPPAFGRGGKGKSSKTWKLDQDLPKLLKLFPDLLSDQAAFVVLSCHDPKWSSQRLADALQAALPPAAGSAHHIDHGQMMIEASCEGGRPLPMGVFARWRSPALRQD